VAITIYIHAMSNSLATVRNPVDLPRKLGEFRDYYNADRVQRALAGSTPTQRAGAPSPVPASLDHFNWHPHCRGPFRTPIPA